MIDKDSDSYRLEQHRKLHNLCLPPHPHQQSALYNCQKALQESISHLDKVLNQCTTHDEQQRADKSAREWLKSIGAT